MAKKKSAKQLERDIADSLATTQVRERFGPKVADAIERYPGRYVAVAWTFDAAVLAAAGADPGRAYQEANYTKTDMPGLLASLRKHGVRSITVNDREVEL
jgi:hypothetical protein